MGPRFSLVVLVVLVVLSSGCTSESASREGDGTYVHETRDVLPESSFQGSFRAANGTVWLAYFNLTEPGRGSYSFEVGDGGHARACFYSQRGLFDMLEVAYAPKNNKIYEGADEHGCTRVVAAAEAVVALPAGALAFAFYSRDCPHLDCAYRLDVRHDGDRSLTSVADATSLFGRIDGIPMDDPAYPDDPADFDATVTPMASEG